MNSYMRTDLACESTDTGTVQQRKKRNLRGFPSEETIDAPNGTRTASILVGKVWEMDTASRSRAVRAVAVLLNEFLYDALGHAPHGTDRILVAGLGNRHMTADALGPRCADGIAVTAGVNENTVPSLLGCCRVSAFAPGVTGQTGIDSAALIQNAAHTAGAVCIIVADALAARAPARLGTTVQITNAGIRPGSGTGLGRSVLSRDSVGIPVIAIGIPTVIDSATLISDTLLRAGIHTPTPALHKILEESRNFLVSPKEGDLMTEAAADFLSRTINRALLPGLFQE